MQSKPQQFKSNLSSNTLTKNLTHVTFISGCISSLESTRRKFISGTPFSSAMKFLVFWCDVLLKQLVQIFLILPLLQITRSATRGAPLPLALVFCGRSALRQETWTRGHNLSLESRVLSPTRLTYNLPGRDRNLSFIS